ncbi:MAG: hypothetical protein JSR60_05030 [Proteobacteria bacterium]|nr:hypothetical protein [Pseudomonadota bacterium]
MTPDRTIATYKPIRAFFLVVILFFLFLSVPCCTLALALSEGLDRVLRHPNRLPLILFAIGAWLSWLAGCRMMVDVIKQIALNGRRAIWIANEKIVILSRLLFSVPRSEITSISTKTFAGLGASGDGEIVLSVSDGRKRTINTAAYLEGLDEIADSIQKIVSTQ